jgi:hypothetical protein
VPAVAGREGLVDRLVQVGRVLAGRGPVFRTEKVRANCAAPFLPTGGNQRYCTSCRSTHETPQMQLRKKLDRIADHAMSTR